VRPIAGRAAGLNRTAGTTVLLGFALSPVGWVLGYRKPSLCLLLEIAYCFLDILEVGTLVLIYVGGVELYFPAVGEVRLAVLT
jgi:hypothetical protein